MHENGSNMITVVGTVVGSPDYSHSTGAEKFLKGLIRVNRTSGQSDLLPFMVSERLAPDWTLGDGDVVELNGQVRSFNVFNDPNGRSRLDVYIFVREIRYEHEFSPQSEEAHPTKNIVTLSGRICKPPVYRVTPFGREICDMMLAVNRAFGKTDYIPCIAWGRTAKFAGNNLKPGDNVKIEGRFQSREYRKIKENGASETRTAYEVSAFNLYA